MRIGQKNGCVQTQLIDKMCMFSANKTVPVKHKKSLKVKDLECKQLLGSCLHLK